MTQTTQTGAGAMRELISFRIGAQEFCVDIMAIREIRGWTPATALPQSPAFVKGVINLRGAVLPVVDLAAKFGHGTTEPSRTTCIVVVEVLLDNEATVIGALADSVEEVIDLEPQQIQPAPRIGTQIRTDFIKGMGKRDTQFIMILDIDKVFSAEELASVRAQDTNRPAEAAA